jgi:hypothetical protein
MSSVGEFTALRQSVEWLARQITEAFPWNEARRYLIGDRERAYGSAVTRGLRAVVPCATR